MCFILLLTILSCKPGSPQLDTVERNKKQPLPQRSYRTTIREDRWAETDGGTEGNNETSMMDIRTVIRLIIYPHMVKFAMNMML